MNEQKAVILQCFLFTDLAQTHAFANLQHPSIVLLRGLCWKTSKSFCPGCIMIGSPKPTQLAPFNAKEEWPYSQLPVDVWAPHPISKVQPTTLQRKLIPAFNRCILLVTTPDHMWGLDIYWLVIWKLSLFATIVQYNTHVTADIPTIQLFTIHLLLCCEQYSEIVKCLFLGQLP